MKKYVIVDIDGTIAKVGDRLKYLQQVPKDYENFYNHCNEDECITDMRHLVNILHNNGYSIVFCTGRKSYCSEQTITWLQSNFSLDFGFTPLVVLMRDSNDNRHDIEVKPELLAKEGIVPENTFLILEDRTSMCKKWRELGFRCLQVDNGDY
jgi:hypothetical protein